MMRRQFRTRRRRITIALLLALFWIGFISWLILPQPIPPLAGKILYPQDRTLVQMTLPSGSPQPIQQFDQQIGQARWSPDGTRIALTLGNGKRIDGTPASDLYVMNADGGGIRQLTHDLLPDVSRWSPDGRYIAFVSVSFASGTAIFVVDVTSGAVTQLTQYATRDLDPQWSPDSRRIAFTSSRDGFQSIYSMTPQGTDFRQLAQIDHLNALQPDWSPDGRRIAYITQYSVGDGTAELHVMNADGSQQRQLTQDAPIGEFEPSWAPDSQRIVYMAGTTTTVDLFIMNVDTGETRQLTHAAAAGDAYVTPRWLPDGDHILFTSILHDVYAASVIDVRGENIRGFLSSQMNGVPALDWVGG